MSKISAYIRRASVVVIVLLLTFAAPVISYADVAPADAEYGITHPSGAAAITYTYNSDSGLWENDYYTWNPTTKETLPKQALEYTYNPSTGLWDSQVWEFHPNVDRYEQITVSVSQPPSGAITHGGPTPAPAPVSDSSSDTSASDPSAAAESTGPANSSPALAPQSSTQVNLDSSGGLNVVQGSTTSLNNSIGSYSQSGNALLQNNFLANDATSGDAAGIATIINLLQSNAGLDGTNLATFMKNIQGDVSGDLLIDPSSIAQPASSLDSLGNVDINTTQNSAIHNDIDLAAASGNATIDNNMHAGNATSGSADAVANVINLINSVIAANQSFVGVVNIYGNYTGNILVPTDSLNALLASNSGGTPAVPLAQTADSTVKATNNLTTNSDQSIANNIDLAAASGSAVQDDNYHSGNATTGNSLTNLTILNLTGHQVTAANSLLVFVNVLGKWVGVIMDAPAGATSAALTGGATSTTTTNTESNTNITATQNESITNNIKAHATSGDATVSNNYNSGNATTGNATASANVANVVGSSFSLTHWFGILFINVFGNWIGNFGAAPAVVARAQSDGSSAGPVTAVFQFTPSSSGSGGSTTGIAHVDRSLFSSDAQYDDFTKQVGAVLAAHDIAPNLAAPIAATQSTSKTGLSLSFVPLAIGFAGLTAVGAEKIHSIRRKSAR